MLKYFLFLFPFISVAQEVFKPSVNPLEMIPMSVEATMKADGHLDEPAWKEAKSIFLNFQVEPFQGRKASFSSEVKVIYNQHFYMWGLF